MRLEHLFFNIAVAIMVGMVYQRLAGRDPTIIIILTAYLPDVDVAVGIVMFIFRRILGTPVLVFHGSFHNLPALAAISLAVAFIASRIGIRFWDAFLCTAIGYGTHLVCDAIAFNEVPSLLWPFGPERTGPVPYWYNPDLFHLAQGSVLVVAVALVLLAALVRTLIERRGWVRHYTHPEFT